MKVIICGSISATDEILEIKQKLEAEGHVVEIPEGVKDEKLNRVGWNIAEKAEIKIKHDLIRGYYEKMKDYDAALVVNPKKNGIDGYIGGNTFLEMGFAHVLKKKLYVLYELPDLPYAPEMIAMQPVVLSGNLDLI